LPGAALPLDLVDDVLDGREVDDRQAGLHHDRQLPGAPISAEASSATSCARALSPRRWPSRSSPGRARGRRPGRERRSSSAYGLVDVLDGALGHLADDLLVNGLVTGSVLLPVDGMKAPSTKIVSRVCSWGLLRPRGRVEGLLGLGGDGLLVALAADLLAVRCARAMQVSIGFAPDGVGKALVSPIQTPAVSCSSPVGWRQRSPGRRPCGPMPIWWRRAHEQPARSRCGSGRARRSTRRRRRRASRPAAVAPNHSSSAPAASCSLAITRRPLR
jgi:hypothetical protein